MGGAGVGDVGSGGHWRDGCLQGETLFSHWRRELLPPGSVRILILHILRNMMIRSTREFSLSSSAAVPGNPVLFEVTKGSSVRGQGLLVALGLPPSRQMGQGQRYTDLWTQLWARGHR